MKSLVGNLKATQPAPKKKASVATVVPADSLDLETSLSDAIDASLNASNGKIWKQSDTFAPSSTNPCPRFAVYRMRGYEQVTTFSPQLRRIFDLGNRVEDAVGDMFRSLGILVDEQVEVVIEDPVPIKGYIDFIIDWDGPKPVECKSINEAGFMWRKTYHKPKDEHFRQLQFYLLWGNYDSGFLFYYCKNDSAILPLLVKRDDAFIAKTLEKYAKILKVYKDGNLPERPYKKSSANCTKCDAFDYCWADKEVGVPVNLRKKD